MGVLGPVEQFKGGRVADVGRWLVVFRNNSPVSLQGTGGKVRKGWSAPLIGATVAVLDATPQRIQVDIRDIRSADGFHIPWISVDTDVRLTPERDNSQQLILDRIARDGERFFESIQVEQSHEIERHVRAEIGRYPADEILSRGVRQLLFPGAAFHSSSDAVEVTSIQDVRWEEAGFAKGVRESRERDYAESQELEFRLAKVAREAHLRSLEQQLDADHALSEQELQAKLDARELEVITRRAEALGIDPLAIAEPETWQALVDQHGQLLDTLLHSQQLYPILRSNPELMRAVAMRLGGNVGRIPAGRQADMLLDAADPSRVMELPAGSNVVQRPDTFIEHAPMTVHPVIDRCWVGLGGQPALTATGLSTSGTTAMVLLVAADGEPAIPNGFEADCAAALRDEGFEVERVAVYGAQAGDWGTAIEAFVTRAGATSVDLSLRSVADRQELVVELLGGAQEALRVHRRLNNVKNPIVPALEDLADGRVDVRVVPRGMGK